MDPKKSITLLGSLQGFSFVYYKTQVLKYENNEALLPLLPHPIFKRPSRYITRRFCILRIKGIDLFRSFIKIRGAGPNTKQGHMKLKKPPFPLESDIFPAAL